ncbi:hypothetical protein OPS25_12310 [Alteromonas ponticola]|uniref:Uncharacterized protein n=1 Tax=Alteromonas aquimaris TaxID=2998417 RepID=A0ABT3P932_9ALTE|nr:hypothetical protein [Alteromonas aquimaris]MCW8109283.1 hypothetical protein [Alteromonas aquimaris]
MKKFIAILFVSLSGLSCASTLDELSHCGIDVSRKFDGRDDEYVEVQIDIDQSDLTIEECKKIGVVTLSNFKTSEWTYFNIENAKASVNFRLKVEGIDVYEIMLAPEDIDTVPVADRLSHYIRISASDLVSKTSLP